MDRWILTDEEMGKFEMGADKVGVYVPQAYNFAGQLYILPRSRVRHIENITSGEAMKYTVTGGVVNLDDDDDTHADLAVTLLHLALLLPILLLLLQQFPNGTEKLKFYHRFNDA